MSPKGLEGPLGVLLRREGQEESGVGSGGPREVPRGAIGHCNPSFSVL